MLEDARADSAQRVAVLAEVYAKRDHVASLAVAHAATLSGAVEVVTHALERAKIVDEHVLASLAPEAIINSAIGLFGIDLSEKTDPK